MVKQAFEKVKRSFNKIGKAANLEQKGISGLMHYVRRTTLSTFALDVYEGAMEKPVPKTRIFTLGHSNRPLKDFLEILEAYKLKLLIDVRTIPKSRSNPQFSQTNLKRSLARRGIEYIHMPGLGGLRRPQKDSPNQGWRNSSFRGFADYMHTEEFEKNLKRLISRSKRKRLVIVCAEAVPWRCHRSLIADALKLKGIEVEEILSRTSHRAHKLTSFLKVRNQKPIYPFDPRDQVQA